MNQSTNSGYAIVPRQDLDFGLDGDVPRYWFGGDAFKTRFFDAMSCLFPEGERFFINCVRDYREDVADPVLKQQVKDFMRQEAQHGRIHTQFNERLQAQGIRVDVIESKMRSAFIWFRAHVPKSLTLAQTAAAEHMTAIMSHGFFDRNEIFEAADPRVRAMFMWHGVEEIEHKAVAFDVLKNVAKASYFTRVFAMAYVSLLFPMHTFMIMRHMFKVDGFSFRQRFGLWARGLRWLYGWNGLYRPIVGAYLAYYKPGFHPWQDGEMTVYSRWLAAFEQTGDPVTAGDMARLAAA